MIYIKRDRKDEQDRIIKPNDAWFDKAKKATANATPKMEANGNIYAHDQVKMALKKLFHAKCAYCESILIDDWDVEHFRPKGKVTERKDHPGYYWLAYEWHNLYPSCKHCNESRVDKASWDDSTSGGTGGKMNQFPLADETMRAMSPQDDITKEQPLLFDPCADDPSQHLGFDPLGQIYARNNSPKGKETIKICFLKRKGLYDERLKIINQVTDLLMLIRQLADKHNANAVIDFQNYLQKHFLADFCRYAAVARHVVNHPDEFGL